MSGQTTHKYEQKRKFITQTISEDRSSYFPLRQNVLLYFSLKNIKLGFQNLRCFREKIQRVYHIILNKFLDFYIKY